MIYGNLALYESSKNYSYQNTDYILRQMNRVVESISADNLYGDIIQEALTEPELLTEDGIGDKVKGIFDKIIAAIKKFIGFVGELISRIAGWFKGSKIRIFGGIAVAVAAVAGTVVAVHKFKNKADKDKAAKEAKKGGDNGSESSSDSNSASDTEKSSNKSSSNPSNKSSSSSSNNEKEQLSAEKLIGKFKDLRNKKVDAYIVETAKFKIVDYAGALDEILPNASKYESVAAKRFHIDKTNPELPNMNRKIGRFTVRSRAAKDIDKDIKNDTGAYSSQNIYPSAILTNVNSDLWGNTTMSANDFSAEIIGKFEKKIKGEDSSYNSKFVKEIPCDEFLKRLVSGSSVLKPSEKIYTDANKCLNGIEEFSKTLLKMAESVKDKTSTEYTKQYITDMSSFASGALSVCKALSETYTKLSVDAVAQASAAVSFMNQNITFVESKNGGNIKKQEETEESFLWWI